MPAPAIPLSVLRAGALVLLAALAGCADPGSAKPGTLLSDMEKRYGPPGAQCPGPDGGQRVVWSQQPEGSTAWAAYIGADGRLVSVAQVLNPELFGDIEPGWTPGQVRCVFGPPANIGTAGLGEMREVVWTYYYLQDQHWHMALYVYMGADGKRVTHHGIGPDARYRRSE
ncbi:hypothetical protein CAL29_04595 [Bordetella genomosp. 10]|uniref:Lipoprotein n=1 Tax=Bordetella genomosp. 10 TaxID=1416804 RepID=A0A261SNB7_9BORD|nr:hypothetical protein [Bordetella genomosp. 10]OZI38615.1 hypothetical protein CAL29_04595 [Bordetella genomosp. 10]